LDEINDDGSTALMYAVQKGSTEIVEMLLKAGAKVEVANKRGETALDLAGEEIKKKQTILSKVKVAVAYQRDGAAAPSVKVFGTPAKE
jgi:ankyrin repeat protein